MNKKKVLYIGAMAMWDHILSIPFLLQLKEKWYTVTLLKYHPQYFGWKLSYVFDYVSNFLYENKLFDETLYVPYNKFKLIWFILKNLLRFPIVHVPVKTFFSTLWARLLGKKINFAVKDINDISQYPGIVQWLLQDKTIKNLFDYRYFLQIPRDVSYIKKFWISKKFITIFPSIFERSINVTEWKNIISFLHWYDFTIVLVWWTRENWLYDDLKKYHLPNIINLCWKTDFKDILNILSDAKLNISANGGIMWLGHLLNKNNISFHITSWYITQPPVDNIHSFNIRKYPYPCCKPCEPTHYRADGIKWIPSCVFAWTDREAECKKSIIWEDIILCLKKILN